MNAPRDDEGIRTRAVERYRRLLEGDPELQRSTPSPAALERLGADARL